MSFVYLGQIGFSNGPYVLNNGLQVLGNGNGPLVLGIGPHVLGIMSYSGLCRIRYYVAFGVMSFGIMSFGIMLHSGLCCIQHNVAFGIMLHSELCCSGLCRSA